MLPEQWTDEDEAEAKELALHFYQMHCQSFSISPMPYQGIPDYGSIRDQCLQNARRTVSKRKTKR